MATLAATNSKSLSELPLRMLPDGSSMPGIGLGTFGSDKYTGEQVADAVIDAAKIGFRHFDCASVYGNEPLIGNALSAIIGSGVPREQLWVTSKVWNDSHNRVVDSCAQSLRDLKVGYLDLFLVHWPFPNSHSQGVGVDSRDPHAVPYIHADFMKTWAQMESLVKNGMVKNIGTSNTTIPKLKLLLRDAEILPVANEMEMHPHFQQPELFRYVVDQGIVPIAYSPLGSPSRPERDRSPDDTVDLTDPAIVGIAQRLNLSPAGVCIKWAIQRGAVPIPFSVKPSQYTGLFQAVTSAPLTEADMQEISGIDKNNRLIKGQVFLWSSAQSWEDLWDTQGVVVD